MSNAKCQIIGLTGPIGSGKSEAAKIFKRAGALLIEADHVGHNLYVPQSKVWGQIVKAFGSVVLGSEGRVNRKKLGEIVFADPKKLDILNRITHPLIMQEIKKEIASCELSVVSCKLIIVDAALPQLFEGLVDRVILITATKEKRLKRLIKKGLEKNMAQKRISLQMAAKEYLDIADIVIENNGPLKQFKEKIKQVLASNSIIGNNSRQN
ncbi:dephospho-CoA kinase [Candidatus Saganbacteria bacterium]|nr:dephospho-CoA kinase [Candidatus Saganbacteria bacterium]